MYNVAHLLRPGLSSAMGIMVRVQVSSPGLAGGVALGTEATHVANSSQSKGD